MNKITFLSLNILNKIKALINQTFSKNLSKKRLKKFNFTGEGRNCKSDER